MALLKTLSLGQAVPISPTTIVVIAFIAIILGYLTFQKLNAKQLGDKLPWVGVNDGEWFAHTRASLRTLSNLRSITDEGYRKFSRSNKLFVAPNLLSGPEILLPHDQIQRVLSEPDSVLDAHKPQQDSIQSKYTIDNPRVMDFPVHRTIITKRLTRNLGQVTPALADELKLGFQDLWGTDTEHWREVPLNETIMKIVARTANRVFAGLPLCRNEEFLESCRQYTIAVFTTGTLISNFPSFMRPIVGRLLTGASRKHLAICFKHTKPIILERLALIEQKMNDPSMKDVKLPNDYITWQIEESYKLNDPEERSPDIINRRLIVMNMVAIHTTTMTSTSTIFDLYSTSPSKGFIEGIREECSRVLAEENGVWTKAALGKMVRLDSTIKESMRITGLGLRGLRRVVADPAGIDFDGVHVAQGATIAFPNHSIHHDERFYPEPMSFDAFRFSRPREDWEASKTGVAAASGAEGDALAGDGAFRGPAAAPQTLESHLDPATKKDLDKVLQFKNNSMVTVSDEFLTFGHGRHACPGRFFASNEIKILLGYLVQHYDIEPLPTRPQDKMVASVLQSSQAPVRVRRRREAA